MVVHQAYSIDGRVVRYAEALAATGGEVDVLCLHDPAGAAGPHRDGIRVLPIPLRKRASRPLTHVLEYVAAWVLFTLHLSVLHLRRRYDVIHVHNMPDFLVFVAVLPRLLGAKVVLDVHDPMPEVFESKFGRARRTRWLLRLLALQERLAARFSHAVITANDNFEDVLVARGVPAEKVTVVRNVADPELFVRRNGNRPRRRDESFTLVFPGTIAPRYGLDVAIRGMVAVARRVPRARLVIVGKEGAERDELAALAERLGVADSVVFEPLVPIEELPALLESADVGIYPAIPDAHMTIAEPGKVLEYAAMGLPVVASRVAVLEQAFGDSAIAFFEPGDPDDFARRVIELAEHPERRRELVRNADETFVRQVTWQEQRARYLRLLARLTGIGLRVEADEEAPIRSAPSGGEHGDRQPRDPGRTAAAATETA